MWKNIKSFLVKADIFIYQLLLLFGYFAALDVICNEYKADSTLILMLGIAVAFVALYNKQKDEDVKKENELHEETELKEKIVKATRLIYETNFENFKSILSIDFKENSNYSLFIFLKNGIKIGINLEEFLKIGNYQKLLEIDNHIFENPNKREIDYYMYICYDVRLDLLEK